MNLEIRRHWYTDKSTISQFLVDGAYRWYTLEDKVRSGPKIYGETAIPAGRYEVIINFSERFKDKDGNFRRMPLLLNVPGFSGVRIHCGNTAADTLGCLLMGSSKGEDRVNESTKAYDSFFPSLDEALKIGKVFIDIIDDPITDTRKAA